MRNEKYIYNEKTLQYERFKLSRKEKTLKFFGGVSAVIFTGLLFSLLLSKYYPSPQQRAMASELEQMKFHFNSLNENFDKLATRLEQLHEKDNSVHRMIFGMKPIEDGVWNGGVGGHDKFDYINTSSGNGAFVKDALVKANTLERKMAMQKKSLDSLFHMASKREKKLVSVPSIKPVRGDMLNAKTEYLSGYGIRLHPVHKVKKFHKGIDFTAPKGTAIQATGDGKVIKAERGRNGYGNTVEIDHGFGYKTLYAHMHTIDVKVGQKVKKGQKIGSVGNTGISTAPHLHYEVHINGRAVNPIDYVLDGLTPKEYKEIVAKAQVENQSWD